MKTEKRICFECREIFNVYEFRQQEFCSHSCAQSFTNRERSFTEENLKPVDIFFSQERFLEEYKVSDMDAIDSAISMDDYDAIYGIEDGDFDDLSPRERAYSLMRTHPELVVILCKCKHGGGYRHHPDYDKPYEIEDLCLQCHSKVHYKQRKESFAWCTKHRSLAISGQSAVNQ